MPSPNQQVSILIPAYRPDYLRRALESALAQDHPPAEVLVSDDSPGQDVFDVVREFQADGRVAYSRNPGPAGLCPNYLRLAGLASSGWLKYLDDDDELAPDAVSGLLEAAAGCPEAVLAFAGVRFEADGLPARETREDLPPCIPGLEYLRTRYQRTPITLFSRMLVRREIMDAVRGMELPPRMISLDEAVGITAALTGSIAYADRVSCLHRIHASGAAQCVELEVLLNDLAYVAEPCRLARRRDLAPRAEVDRFERRMLTKLARSSLTRLLARGRAGDARRFLDALRRLDPAAARRAVLSWRVGVKALRAAMRRKSVTQPNGS
jgi:glycosyltransferase involved in cell wall biosynthesis